MDRAPETPARILVFAGSAREASFNKRLARLAASRLKAVGAQATFVDLADYPMPLYDGDLEHADGVPANARRLRDLLADHSGLLLVSPEYNGFITPLMKNTIDWLSRPDTHYDRLELFRGRGAALLGASPSGLGALRSLMLMRQLLGNLGVTVLPDQLAVAQAPKAFAEDGQLADADQQARLDAICARLADTVQRLHA